MPGVGKGTQAENYRRAFFQGALFGVSVLGAFWRGGWFWLMPVIVGWYILCEPGFESGLTSVILD
jgi:uncharacterized membrane protein (DUF106 family)